MEGVNGRWYLIFRYVILAHAGILIRLIFLKTIGSVFHCLSSPANRYSPDEESGAAAIIRFI
jgi:hypothetical protein